MQAALPDPNLIEKMSPWRMRFRQIEPGPMQTCVKVRSGSILTLLEISMNKAVHQQGLAPPGTLTFGVSLSHNPFRWHGANMQNKRVLTFGNEGGFEGLTSHTFHGLTFSVDNSEIDALSDRLGISIDDRIRSCGVFEPALAGGAVQTLSETTLSYLKPIGGSDMGLNEEEQLLAFFLQLVAPPNQQKDRSTGRQRARAVRVALDFMESHIGENVPISRICESAGVPQRTLNRAFHDQCGVGPKAYYLRMRLGLLRRVLLEQKGFGRVSDAANQYGFWHMGQLARDYQAQFGELPSQTCLARPS
ncbi:Helix-turn-helix domain-containing protein [Shimia gijangensis]|uniref:Helix-turn-helix domain-containing protein n=1 Tax=Shimia gijangensis TaxID=1470563 RepID=A0A1M6FYT9_9RHOB|nr:helix-turn-helix domain-containing protein [Shimia gijangensis]SHJ02779.1 Helix-turn-helix domain-containing protein [Shimia gijangensis]